MILDIAFMRGGMEKCRMSLDEDMDRSSAWQHIEKVAIGGNKLHLYFYGVRDAEKAKMVAWQTIKAINEDSFWKWFA